jgi:MtrB/PioB family decaheme-associated outer membrane protein
MSKITSKQFNLAPVAAVVLLTFGSAYAQVSPEVKEQTTPESVISVGVGAISSERDAARFGQYTGFNKYGALLLDIELIKRDDLEGLWTTLTGRNLGLESRELSFSQQKQGSWKYTVDYNEMVRYDPYVITTGMTGIGTANPTVNLIQRPNGISPAWATANGFTASNGVPGHEEQLKLKRTAVGLSGDVWINSGLQMEVNFRNEQKQGARMFGRVGIDSSDMQLRPNAVGASANGGWAVLLTPEPIDAVTKAIEAKLNYNRGDLSLSGGYYGSFYTNNFGSLSPNVPGTLNRGVLWTNCATAGCSTIPQLAAAPVALPPDNQAHQLYLSGTYAFSQATRANFKVAYTHATQDESFVGTGLTPSVNAPASLGGVVDTTLMQAGLTMRATKDLSVNANVRYEDRADKTPSYAYNTNGVAGSALNNTINWASGSQTRTTAKVDGIYRLPSGYSATVGMDWENKKTPLPPANSSIFTNQVVFRSATDETGIHAVLRKIMSESLNGSVGYEIKQRRGSSSDWYTGGAGGAAPLNVNPATSNFVLSDLYMDRDRTRVRGSLDWSATDSFALQAVLEHGHDFYYREGPYPVGAFGEIAGARVISSDALTLDASYKLSEDWRVNGFWTHSENRWKVNKASLADDTQNYTETFGLTMRGKVTSRLGVGLDFLMTNDKTSFQNMPAAGNIAGYAGQTQPGNFLPDINYNNKKVNLYGMYDLDKKSAIRVNVVYQEFTTDDWQWGYAGVPYVYSDNTTVSANLNQTMTFVGVSYIYKFQ